MNRVHDFVACLAALGLVLGTLSPAAAGQVQGKIRRVLPERQELVVADDAGKDWTFRIAPHCLIRAGGKAKALGQLEEYWPVSVDFAQEEQLLIATAVTASPVYFMKVPPESDQTEYTDLTVFYATDRRPNRELQPDWRQYAREFSAAGGVGLLAVLLGWWAFHGAHRAGKALAVAALLATLGLAVSAANNCVRRTGGALDLEALYGGERGRGVQLGTCVVSLPRLHELGRLEEPSVLRFEFRYVPEKHVMLQSVEPRPADQFYALLREQVERSARRAVFVFVHGYGVTFADAARRTAQLRYDLEFQGPPVFFSWPSQGRLLGYTVDETNVEWAVPDLARFLDELAARSGAATVHVIAHSMGNRALAGALRALAAERAPGLAALQQVILAAPDMDAEIFKRDVAPGLVSRARRVTLYASSKDEALVASKQVHGYPRAGESGENLVVVPGLDTIDVSAADTSLTGHSYYGDSQSLLFDLYAVVNQGLPPPQRVRLRPAEWKGLPYWVFKAGEPPPRPARE